MVDLRFCGRSPCKSWCHPPSIYLPYLECACISAWELVQQPATTQTLLTTKPSPLACDGMGALMVRPIHHTMQAYLHKAPRHVLRPPHAPDSPSNGNIQGTITTIFLPLWPCIFLVGLKPQAYKWVRPCKHPLLTNAQTMQTTIAQRTLPFGNKHPHGRGRNCQTDQHSCVSSCIENG